MVSLLSLAAATPGCRAASDAPPPLVGATPSGFGQRQDTERFSFFWNEGETTVDEVKAVRGVLDQQWEFLESFLGRDRVPHVRVAVTFVGDLYGTDGSFHPPSVDANGILRLTRQPNVAGDRGYAIAAPHELVHALRGARSLDRRSSGRRCSDSCMNASVQQR